MTASAREMLEMWYVRTPTTPVAHGPAVLRAPYSKALPDDNKIRVTTRDQHECKLLTG